MLEVPSLAEMLGSLPRIDFPSIGATISQFLFAADRPRILQTAATGSAQRSALLKRVIDAARGHVPVRIVGDGGAPPRAMALIGIGAENFR